MIKEDAGNSKQIVALTVVHRDVVGKHFRDAIGATWIKRCQFRLRCLPNFAEHLA